MKRVVVIAALVAVLASAVLYRYGRGIWYPYYRAAVGARSVADVLAEYGPAAEARLAPHFRAIGATYPPAQIALVGYKSERRLEVWIDDHGRWRLLTTYPVLAASGGPGPKLREGDRQVPEGVYRIEALNPNSSYHLSLKLDYPNAFDQARAAEDGRTDPGSNIFIHGKAVSIGCLAIGDPAIEELFTLVAAVGRENIEVIIAPHDPSSLLVPPDGTPFWTAELYDRISAELEKYRR